jgi:hypothetical protein
MKTNQDSLTLDRLVKENYTLPFEELKELCTTFDLVVNDRYLRQLQNYQIDSRPNISGAYFNPVNEWIDKTPIHHRETKTYKQLMLNEVDVSEVVGKKTNK